MKLEFSTKAGTLKSLSKVLKAAKIAPLISFRVNNWKKNPEEILADAIKNLGSELWIVRSSSNQEDNKNSSNAGAFLSVLNVDFHEASAAINEVIKSYGKINENDEVLIQPMLQKVVRSGVAFSHDPNTCSPYRVVNWSEGLDTTAITGGFGGQVWQQAAESPIPPPLKLRPVINLLEELLHHFDRRPVDCEFAVTLEDGIEVLWLLQARLLILNAVPETELTQTRRLTIVEKKILRGMQPHPFLMGQRTVYGIMPDWNPAEIIGVRPKPLSLSLYRELVTDSIWAYQRNNYGYRNLRSFPLMPHFFGLPYIDIRISFNSFIPVGLEEGLAGRLVDHYINLLLNKPTLHDKIEFEIVFSCYTLDLPERLKSLTEVGFTKIERELIANSLRKLTNRIVHSEDGLWRGDAAKLKILNGRREQLQSSYADPIERIYWLLEDTKRYGTLPFAGLARAGFIAVQILKSLVAVGVFSQDDYDAFLKGISTVSGQLSRDRSILDNSTFMARYGHLRPGTYNILSPRYDEAPELYFDLTHRPTSPKYPQPFALTLNQMKEIKKLLEIHGLQPDPVGLLEFLQAGIELRELSKFHFTRNLSDALALIGEVGNEYGFNREELAYSDISVFKELHISATDAKDLLHRSIEQGKTRYKESLKISLPPLITNPKDVWAFQWPDTSPNFITQGQITANVTGCETNQNLDGNIICIQNADPGFDWLFAYPIAGLITAWGGANSHMAIRAGELGLPAVIGAGEILYGTWSNAKRLHIDCAAQRVEVLA